MKAILLIFITAFSVSLFAENNSFDGIQISGDSKFNKQITLALELLRKDSPSTYFYVKNYIGRIKQHEKSGMDVYSDPPTYNVSNKTAFHSLSWCASTIVHDAYHSYLFHEYKINNKGKVPYDAWGGTNAELKSIKVQIFAMKEIRAPQYQIDYLEKADGTHGDVDGDGKLTQKDYELRDW